MSLCARSLVGSALRALPRRAVRSSRDATPLGTSGGRRRVQGARAVRGVVSAASSSTRAVAPPWKEEVLESHSLLGNVCFVLCGPQGPQNVGSVARVMQNFGIYDLRITEPGPFVLAGGTREDVTPADGASSSGGVNSGATLGPDGLGSELPPALRPTRPDGDPADDPTSPDPLCDEAYRFACAADWLLAESRRCDTALDAIADCTFVMATTARTRGNVPLVTARVAAEMLAREAKRGKVAVLFGNERTGLTNEELAQAHACVAIPTAGQGTLCRRSLKYTGGTGPTSLNLSQAVGVLAYEMFMAADAARLAGDDDETVPGSVPGDGESAPKGVNAGRIDLPASQLMTVGEKNTLLNELLAARRSLDVLPNETDTDDAEDSSGDDAGEEDDDLDVREERGIERVLNSSPLARRDAAALFQLARRVKAAAKAGDESSGAGSSSGLLDAAVLRAVAEVDGTRTVRKARAKIRDRLGVSLTNREIARAIRRAAAGATAASSE